MPLRRTPPDSPAPPMPADDTRNEVKSVALKKKSALTLKHCESEPKRKLDGENSDIFEFIQNMFSSFTSEQNLRFQELQASIEHMSNKYDEFLSKIAYLEKERQSDKLIIKDLEDKLETLERKSRGVGIEIRNIPKQKGETKDILVSEISKLGEILKVDINNSNIKDIYRLKTKDSSDPVVVNFTTVLLKEKVINSVKKFNKIQQTDRKLNTTHLNSSYSQKPIYISEALTRKTQKLYYLARQFRKSHGYSFCWTANGVVYLKSNENSSHIRINSESDLEKLRKNIKPQ